MLHDSMESPSDRYLAVVCPDDERLFGGPAGDDTGEVECGALAQEHLWRTEDVRTRVCRETKTKKSTETSFTLPAEEKLRAR